MIYEVERSVFAFPFFIPHNMFWTPKKKQQLSSPRIGASVTDIHKMIIVTSAASEYSCIRVSLREISSSCANGKVGVFLHFGNLQVLQVKNETPTRSVVLVLSIKQ